MRRANQRLYDIPVLVNQSYSSGTPLPSSQQEILFCEFHLYLI